MQSLAFSLIYLGLLIVPGLALHSCLLGRRSNLLLIIALSYSLFALVFITATYFALSANAVKAILAVYLTLSIGAIWARKPQFRDAWLDHPSLFIICASLIYQAAVGAFVEVPADIYAHLERFQTASAKIEANRLTIGLSIKQLLLQRSGVFYHFLAVVNSAAGLSAQQLIEVVDFLNRTLFLLGSYHFSRFVFAERKSSSQIALVCVLFTAVHFGTSVFAYIRYYTLAPTILNMLVYMSAIMLFLQALKGTRFGFVAIRYSLIVLLVMAAAAVHVQEALFVVVIAVAISLVALVGLALSKRTSLNFDSGISHKQAAVVCLLALLGFIALYIYSQLNLTRAPNSHWRLWDFGPSLGGFFPQLTVLNLKNQFIQVVTLWGLFVYILFFINFRRYRTNLIIVAAMLSPILTILNPFFVDLMLRHYNSTTLWRFCFLLPLHLVAADLLIYYWRSAMQGKLSQRTISAVIVLALLGLLLPIANTWNQIHFSRAPSLHASDPSLGPQQFQGLIDYLDTLDKKEKVLTDPMTGYMISALTKHQSKRRKFFRDSRFIRFTFETYQDAPLQPFKGYLLVTNLTAHPRSKVGKLSNHWSGNQWQRTASYYPPVLIDHLHDNPQRFTKTWSNDDLAVYRIN